MRDLDWKSVKRDYDNGFTVDMLCKKYKTGHKNIREAFDRKILIKRTHSESMKLCHSKGNHPGWKSVNLNKDKRNRPEEIFYNEILKDKYFDKYTILEKFSFKQYVFDFVILELQLDIEIDGQHHLFDKYTIEKDKKRDKIAIENDWKVFRISCKEFYEDKDSVFDKLKTFMESNEFISKYNQEKILKLYGKKYCKECSKVISKKSSTGLCHQCLVKSGWYQNKNHPKKVNNRPTKEELEEMIEEMSWVAIGRKYSVSDNAVRKWAKAYKII